MGVIWWQRYGFGPLCCDLAREGSILAREESILAREGLIPVRFGWWSGRQEGAAQGSRGGRNSRLFWSLWAGSGRFLLEPSDSARLGTERPLPSLSFSLSASEALFVDVDSSQPAE